MSLLITIIVMIAGHVADMSKDMMVRHIYSDEQRHNELSASHSDEQPNKAM